MKKVILLIMVLACAVTAQGQISWQVKAGYGLVPRLECRGYYRDWRRVELYSSGGHAVFLGANVDIPLRKHSRWIISPGLNANIGVSEEALSSIYTSALLGYRVRMGHGMLFVPKIGVVLGGGLSKGPESFGSENSMLPFSYEMPSYLFLGPQIDLTFEIKHFILNLNWALSAICPEEREEGTYESYSPSYRYEMRKYTSSVTPINMNFAIGYRF